MRLDCEAERAFDESPLGNDIDLRQPANLPLTDDVHCLIASEAMILLEDIVQIGCSSTSAVAAQFPGLFELFNCTRIRRMTVDVDHAWSARQPVKSQAGGKLWPPSNLVSVRAENQSCSRPSQSPDIDRSTFPPHEHTFHQPAASWTLCSVDSFLHPRISKVSI
jgi:hypothetical protein